MDVSRDKKKDQFASSGLLLQISSLSVVYHFHLLCIIQKYVQVNPEFRGQATKSCASSAQRAAEPGQPTVAGPLPLPSPAKVQREAEVLS